MKSTSTSLTSSRRSGSNSNIIIKRSKSSVSSTSTSTSKSSSTSVSFFCLGFAVGVTVLLNIQNSLELFVITTTTSSSSDESFYYNINTPNPPPTTTTTKSITITKGQQIVSNAYNVAYRDLTTKYCPDLGRDYFIQTDLPDQFENLRICLNTTYDKIIHDPTLIANQYPWWLLTLLRDTASKKSGLHGRWHYISLSQDVEMCVYEKGGTKHWKKVFQNQELLQKKPYKGKHVDKSQIVFIRDPLDRFLSGFLDKCVTRHYQGEKHCEPSEIFQVEFLQLENKTKEIGFGLERRKYRDYLHSVENKNLVSDFRKRFEKSENNNNNKQRLLFDAYVDAFPLKWNVHFIPLSFMCGGLYNTLKYYNFIGSMGTNFYVELSKLTTLYPSIKESVDLIFELENHTTTTYTHNHDENQKQQSSASSSAVTNNKTKTNTNNVGVETQAASKVLEYYTPRTVKKVLEYVSIDYKLLNITIPKWAEDMLLLLDE